MTRNYAAVEREELIQYASELEDLVIGLYAMVVVELETRGFWGFLGRSFERNGIARRMVELGFVGRCEEDAATLSSAPCQKPAKGEVEKRGGCSGLLGSQADFSILDELRPRK